MRTNLSILVIVLAVQSTGCSLLGSLQRKSPDSGKGVEVPVPTKGKYSVDDNNNLVFDQKDFKIEIRYLTDGELNEAFPKNSYKGAFSSNPYTHGNWIDPEPGYTPIMFTVFKVRVINYARPKINLNPWKATLVTDRGDELAAYGRDEKDPPEHSLAVYHQGRRGPTGNDRARFEEKMGIVRKSLYIDGPVFKGDTKEGYMVFDPLDEHVTSAWLILNDFVLAYDATDWPSEVVDFYFPFTREFRLVKRPR